MDSVDLGAERFAGEILDTLFPAGADFLKLPYAKQWAEREKRIEIVKQEVSSSRSQDHRGLLHVGMLIRWQACYLLPARADGAGTPMRCLTACRLVAAGHRASLWAIAAALA